MNELFKRILVAVIGIPLAIMLVYYGGIYFTTVIIVVSAIAQWEFYRMAQAKRIYPHRHIGIAAGTALLAIGAYVFEYQLFLQMIMLFVLFGAGTMLSAMRKRQGSAISNVGATYLGFIYISLSFLFLIMLRNIDKFIIFVQQNQVVVKLFNPDYSALSDTLMIFSGSKAGWLVLTVFFSIWLCDSAAYFIGKALGKHKLFPRLSPKKTWEGAVAGFIFAILTFWLSAHYLLPGLSSMHSIALGAITGSFGQIGDLVESMLKRDAGVKDSSAILPGHGGMLDRFDSIVFVSPLIFIYLVFALIL